MARIIDIRNYHPVGRPTTCWRCDEKTIGRYELDRCQHARIPCGHATGHQCDLTQAEIATLLLMLEEQDV